MNTVYKKFIRPLTIGAALAALVFLIYHLNPLNLPRFLELKSLDLRFQIRGRVSPELPIVIVSIDEDSFDEINLPWPWPRDLHAVLIRKIAEGRAKLIGFDILFLEPKANPREDAALAEAIHEAGNVILGAAYTEVASAFGPKRRMVLPTPLIREHALGYGPVNLITDQDGVVRRGNLALLFQDRIFPHFAYRIYQAIVGEENLGAEKVSPETTIINFRGPARSYPIIPYYRILKDEIAPSLFKDKIVLVGTFARRLPTPFSASRRTAGVEILANFAETLVANDPIVPFPGWGHTAVFFIVSVIAMRFSLLFKPLRAFALVLLLLNFYALVTIYLFWGHQLWVPVVPSLFAIVLIYGGITLDNYILEQKERRHLRETFGKYVSPDVVEEILEDRKGLGLGGKRMHITVLFSDIRGFTSISEQIGPEQVVSFLSDYLGQVTHVVFKNGGTVDKFIGDAVMAVFGAPKSHGDDALRAVRTGIDMIELAKSLDAKWAKIIGVPLKIGVGINSGEAVVGSIGSEIRSDFTAIGDTVNLASRLEGLTKELGVPMLISETTAKEMKNSMPLRELRQVKVTGREAPLLVYTPQSFLEGDVEQALDTTEPYRQQYK